MSLTSDEAASLKITSAVNRRRYTNRKHVALLMGTHASIGKDSPIYRHMRQSPIYDPHVLPILLSFIPTARVLEYSMDAGMHYPYPTCVCVCVLHDDDILI
jgi:hypothetical protein